MLLLCLCLGSSPLQAKETLTIAVASSLYLAMQAKVAVFEQGHDVTVRLISGSTGRLYNQILRGAPFDLFIAADEVRPSLLLQQGRAIASFAVGEGYLGLKCGGQIVTDLARLKHSDIRHISLANPDVAPFGQVTKRLLQQSGLWLPLKVKFVYAQNALQSSMLVQKGLVDAGFVPLESIQQSIAVIPYIGVLLEENTLARSWLKTIEVNIVAATG